MASLVPVFRYSVPDGNNLGYPVLGLGMSQRVERTVRFLIDSDLEFELPMLCCTEARHGSTFRKALDEYKNRLWFRYILSEWYITRLCEKRLEAKAEAKAEAEAEGEDLDLYVPLHPYGDDGLEIAANVESQDPAIEIMISYEGFPSGPMREKMMVYLQRAKQNNLALAYNIIWNAMHFVMDEFAYLCDSFAGENLLAMTIAAMSAFLCYPLHYEVLRQLAEIFDRDEADVTMIPIFAACIFSPHVQNNQAGAYISLYRRLFGHAMDHQDVWNEVMGRDLHQWLLGRYATLDRLEWWTTNVNFYPSLHEDLSDVDALSISEILKYFARYKEAGTSFVQICRNTHAPPSPEVAIELLRGMMDVDEDEEDEEEEDITSHVSTAVSIYCHDIDFSEHREELSELLDGPAHPMHDVIRALLRV